MLQVPGTCCQLFLPYISLHAIGATYLSVSLLGQEARVFPSEGSRLHGTGLCRRGAGPLFFLEPEVQAQVGPTLEGRRRRLPPIMEGLVRGLIACDCQGTGQNSERRERKEGKERKGPRPAVFQSGRAPGSGSRRRLVRGEFWG